MRIEAIWHGSDSDEHSLGKLVGAFPHRDWTGLDRAYEKMRRLHGGVLEGSFAEIVKTPEELDSLIPEMRCHSQLLFDSLRSFRRADQTWSEALNNAWKAVEESIQNSDLVEKWDAIRHAMAKGQFLVDGHKGHYKGRDYAWDPVRAAGWEIAKGHNRPALDGVNPYFPILDLYALKPWRIGFGFVAFSDDEQPEQRLLIDFPVQLGRSFKATPEMYVGCLSFANDVAGMKPREEQVSYYHYYNALHSEAKPLPRTSLGRIVSSR